MGTNLSQVLAVGAFALLAAAAVVQAVYLLRKERRLDPLSHWLLGAAGVLLLAGIVEHQP